MISLVSLPISRLPSNHEVTAVGAAVDDRAGPEADDEGRVGAGGRDLDSRSLAL